VTDEREAFARLSAENEALRGQIEQRVQTEQRLCHSQHELDAQLDRIRSLTGFALASDRHGSPGEILERALALLGRNFALGWAAVVAPEPGAPGVRVLRSVSDWPVAAGPIALDSAGAGWLAAQRGPSFVSACADGPGAELSGIARAIVPSPPGLHVGPGSPLACVPLRHGAGSGPAYVILRGARCLPATLDPGALGDRHLPFLQLVADHVDHAIVAHRLTESLRERSAQLAGSLATLEATQAALVQSQKMEAVGRLAGGVAHDFNNLLTVILGYASTLVASLPRGTPQQAHARSVVEAGRRAAEITSQLLALGRRQVQSPENLDLSEYTSGMAELLRRIAGEHIEVELRLDRALGAVRADRAQLEQVLLNLAVNARDAMPEGGRMRIVTRRATPADAARCEAPVDPAAFGVLEVRDEGVGMDEVTRSRIFEPFFTTKPAGQGSGLGLSVVYGIVRQSGGQIVAQSERGRGSSFTVLLPHAGREAVRPPVPGAPGEPSAARPGRGPVLVVEDEAAIREVIDRVLRRAGFAVVLARDGQAALGMIERMEAPPALVLTDLTMPGMDGRRLAEEVRRRTPGIRIAFMSGYLDTHDEAGGNALGGALLSKPFTPDEVVAFVGRQLALPDDRVAAGADA
jgi:signal transduction histidine kinase/CheY-like chemotaxis protein